MIDFWDVIDERGPPGRKPLEYEVRGRDKPFVVIPAIGLLDRDPETLTPLVRELLKCDDDKLIWDLVMSHTKKQEWGGKSNQGLFLCDEGRAVAKFVSPTDCGYLVCMTKLMELEGNLVRPDTQLLILTEQGGLTITGCDIRSQDIPPEKKFWRHEDGSGSINKWAENSLPTHKDRKIQADYRDTMRVIFDVCKRHGSRIDMGDDNWTFRPSPEIPDRRYESPALSVTPKTHIPIPIDPVTGGDVLSIASLLSGCESHSKHA